MNGPEPTWWYCETCDDTGEVSTDGTGPAWVTTDPCYECKGDPEGYWKNNRRKKMQLQPTSPCEECGWENWVRRKRCRHCNRTLSFHPNPEIDVEVRLDYAAAARSEQRSV